MRIFIVLAVLFLQGCMAVYSQSAPVDREAFTAKGSPVVYVQYFFTKGEYLAQGKNCTNDFVIVVAPCLSGTPEKRAEEVKTLLQGYGFTAKTFRQGDVAAPYAFWLRVIETPRPPDEGVSMPFSMLTSFSMGLIPNTYSQTAYTLSYELYGSDGKRIAVQGSTARVRVVGGIYTLVLGPFLNNRALRSSLRSEHDRALQTFIQGGALN